MAPRRKKARDLPSLNNCHSCGLRFPDKGRKERLRTLDSEWRIVLLCEKCLRGVRSGEVCSYCFSAFSEGDGGFLDCRSCSCRVHLGCIPNERGCVAASELDPDLFTCVDCCAFPRSRIRTCRKHRDSCSSRVSTLSLEDVVRDAECAVGKKVEVAAWAKEKALVKAVEAKSSAELARNALDLVVLTGKDSRPYVEMVVPDEELALQLHQSMNGSHRILRNLQSVNFDQLVDANRENCNSNLPDKESEGGCHSMFREVQFCIEEKFFGLDMICAKDNPAEMPVKEEQGSCSNKVVDTYGDDSSVDSVSASCQMPSVPNGTLMLSIVKGEDSFAMQQQEKHCVPDRFLKKYSRRIPSLKAMRSRNENQGSASVLVHIGRCNASGTASHSCLCK